MIQIREATLRLWCEELAGRALTQAIARANQPYLNRYFLAGWNPTQTGVRLPGVYLHQFVASDPSDQVHSHPWAAVSLILIGAYREHRCDVEGHVIAVRDLHAGDVNVLAVGDRHRIELLTPDVWTLFFCGPFVQPWQFHEACD
jgi:hypothetical protein